MAATSRSSWVVNQIYSYNHPFAATDSAELAIKMSTMAQSAFNFYRGTDHIYFQDMLTLPNSNYTTTQTGYTWLAGDLHLDNFDAARDANGKAVFKLADFDEGYLGQYVWDIRRLASSLVLAGRESGISDSNISTAINNMVAAYADKMSDFKGSSAEASFQLSNSNTTGYVNDIINSADAKKRSDLLAKYTQINGTQRKFQNLSNLLVVDASSYLAISNAFAAYINSIAGSKQYASSYYAIKDIHQKTGSGLGSLGRLRYYVLIEGLSTANTDDVILELKQSTSSAVAQINNGQLPASSYSYNEANRVAKTAKAQLLNADVLTGYTNINGQPYYIHEKAPYQEDFDHSKISGSSPFKTAATFLGQALASAHALADQDYDASIVSYSIDKQVSDAISSKSGLQSEILSFAFNYADQVSLDWQAFAAAYAAGAVLY